MVQAHPGRAQNVRKSVGGSRARTFSWHRTTAESRSRLPESEQHTTVSAGFLRLLKRKLFRQWMSIAVARSVAAALAPGTRGQYAGAGHVFIMLCIQFKGGSSLCRSPTLRYKSTFGGSRPLSTPRTSGPGCLPLPACKSGWVSRGFHRKSGSWSAGASMD